LRVAADGPWRSEPIRTKDSTSWSKWSREEEALEAHARAAKSFHSVSVSTSSTNRRYELSWWWLLLPLAEEEATLVALHPRAAPMFAIRTLSVEVEEEEEEEEASLLLLLWPPGRENATAH
jgi:hypothetical protein